MYKTLNNLALPIEPHFFEKVTATYNLRNDNKLKQSNFNTITYGFKSIACQGPILWNNLPNHAKNTTDFHSFKTTIRKYINLVNYECGSCRPMICLNDNI